MGVLSEPLDLDGVKRKRPEYPTVEVEMGMVLRHRASFKNGVVVGFDPNWVTLRARFAV